MIEEPFELLARLGEGKVYVGEDEQGAAKTFFSKGSLLALREIRRNLLRSFLTILGIVIGVAAVIVMGTPGRGPTARLSSSGIPDGTPTTTRGLMRKMLFDVTCRRKWRKHRPKVSPMSALI